MADLASVISKINKEFKSELGEKGIGQLKIKRIPFTSPRLNYETYGGVPRGRISMFAGKESSGKTTTALDLVKNAQITFKQEWNDEIQYLTKLIKDAEKIIDDKKSTKAAKEKVKKDLPENKERLDFLKKRGPLQIVYFDAEGTIDADWARKLGVDVDNIWLVRLHTQTAEQFLDQVMRVVRDTDDVGMIVIDSIAVLVPQLTHGLSFEQKSMGGNAKVVTDFCNEVCPILGAKGITAVIINQMRDSMTPYADFTIPCGNGLKLASSMILTFQKGKFIDAEGNEQKNSYETPQGNLVWVRIQKTKVCKPDRKCGFYTLNYDYGVDVVADILPMAIDLGVIEKNGGWLKLRSDKDPSGYVTIDGEPFKIQGQANLMAFLRENTEIYEYVRDTVMKKITGTDALAVDAATDQAAIEDMRIEGLKSGEVPDDIVLREDNSDITYEAPDEIPMDEGAAV